jgi:ABC-type phosphate/phosphonate transport system substrate-binding protein
MGLLAPMTLLMMLLCIVTANGAGEDNERNVVIGVLAPMGEAHALRRWQPTADYLSEQIAGHHFTIFPANKKELTKAVKLDEVDFFLTNTGHYVELESMFRATRILTLKQVWNNRVYSQWGSVIFVRGDNETVNELRDIKGKRIAAVYPGAFAGFQVAFRELVESDILSHKDKRDILFTGFPHSTPLKAVMEGEAEVGIIPTGVLEEQIYSGAYDGDSFKVINGHFVEHFPFQVSTQGNRITRLVETVTWQGIAHPNRPSGVWS